MIGGDLPYRLRPAKFVDRELFADLIGQVVAREGRDGWVYISMAGEHLVDIQAVYRRSGISKFYAFDRENRTVERQRFNRNLPSIWFGHHASTALADQLDKIVGMTGAEKAIIWLDFTGTGRRREQIDDFVATLGKLAPGDICRITLDVGNHFYAELRDQWAPEEFKDKPPHVKVAAGYREALAPYCDPSVDSLDRTALAKELIACVGRACPLAADRPSGRVRFVPLLLTCYGDGSSMITATVRCEYEKKPLSPPSGWEWQPKDWSDVQTVRADVLSTRERAVIDTRLDDVVDACAELPFLDDSTVESYVRFHRYQPNFQNVAE